MSRQALLFITVLLINLNLHASEFDGGSPEFDERPNPKYTEAEIQRKIENEMQMHFWVIFVVLLALTVKDQVGRFNLMLAMEVVVETELVITFLLERLRQRLKIIIMLV